MGHEVPTTRTRAQDGHRRHPLLLSLRRGAPRPRSPGSRRETIVSANQTSAAATRPVEAPPDGQDQTEPRKGGGGGGGNNDVSTEFMSQLLAKFPPFDPTWTDDLKAKWFEGFQP